MFKDYFGNELTTGDRVVYVIEQDMRHGEVLSYLPDKFGGLIEIKCSITRSFDSDEHDIDYVRGYMTVKV